MIQERETITPCKPYLVQRIELAGEARNIPGKRNQAGKKSKIDYREIKCVHGGVPAVYDGSAVNDHEASMAMRKRFMSYDYMGSAEFEFGAIPRAYWKFLRAFERGEGSIKSVEMIEPSSGQVEKFWIFAPNATMDVAQAFLKRVCYDAYTGGRSTLRLKESLRFDSALFPQSKRLDGFGRDEWELEKRMKNEIDHVGWFDLNNCFYIFWDRSDIAQAFANLHDFGNVLALEPEQVNIKEGMIPDMKVDEYFKQVLKKNG